MAGNISFEDEEEHRQTEALAGQMIHDISNQHAIVGHTVARAGYTAQNWQGTNMVVSGLTIELANGARITAREAVLDLASAPSGFREALRRENERQRPTAPSGIRDEGARRAAHPGPELGPTGDPVGEQYEDHAEYPIGPPSISGTDITEEV